MHKLFKLSQQWIIQKNTWEILILRKAIDEEVWLLPWWWVEKDESNLEEALKREIEEETWYKVTKIWELIEIDIDEWWETIAHAYNIEVENTENITISKEHSEYKWILPASAIDYLYYKKIAKKIWEKNIWKFSPL